MTPEELAELLDDERGRLRRDVSQLTVADRLDQDEEDGRLGGLL